MEDNNDDMPVVDGIELGDEDDSDLDEDNCHYPEWGKRSLTNTGGSNGSGGVIENYGHDIIPINQERKGQERKGAFTATKRKYTKMLKP